MKNKPVEYRSIPGCPGYRAGSDGSVWSCWVGTGRGKPWKQSDRWLKLKPDIRKIDGRKRFTLKNTEGRLVRKYASFFVLIAFIGPKPEGFEACHRNGDCTNDRPDNLRWGTVVSNKGDMVRHGTRLRGENHPKTKLTDEQINEVIVLRERGFLLREIAKRFKISEARVSQIYLKGER